LTNPEDILAFFFKVHYLSLCAGWKGVAGARHTYNHVECVSKPLGWTFSSDDPFITNYGVKASKLPVVTNDLESERLQTKGPAASLLLGLVLTILAVLTFALELLGLGTWMDMNIARVSTVLMAVCILHFCREAQSLSNLI